MSWLRLHCSHKDHSTCNLQWYVAEQHEEEKIAEVVFWINSIYWVHAAVGFILSIAI